MNTVKIIHTSDLHLDSRLSNFSLDKSKIRRQELKTSFENAMERCGKADIVLMCGDIFDNSNYLKGTVRFLVQIFNKYEDTIFFICGGNHDWYSSPAIQALIEELPDNVVVFSDKAEYMELDDIKVRVYGMSFSDKYQYTSMMDEFHVIEDDYINILMLHGDVVASSGESKYNPVLPGSLEVSGFDYVALGHTHEFSGIKKVGRTTYAYCGTHEGHGFDECGPKGVICGTVGKNYCNLNFVNTCMREYVDCSVDVSDALTVEDIISGVKNAVTNSNNIYKITLVGVLNDSIIMDTDVILSCVDAFTVKIVDSTRRNYNLDELAQRQNLKGFVAKTVLAELADCSDDDVDIVCSGSDYLFELIDNGGGR
ncbi:MAG: metallophosphoesterase [Clostridia bacterium]|nr:metallophosphoesterase [Clostridia bacterium]